MTFLPEQIVAEYLRNKKNGSIRHPFVLEKLPIPIKNSKKRNLQVQVPASAPA